MKRKILIIVDQTSEKISFKGMVFQNGELINEIIYENQSSPAKCEAKSSFAEILSKTYKSKQS